MARDAFRIGCFLAGGLLSCLEASGFELLKGDSDRYVIKWYADQVRLEVHLSTEADLVGGGSPSAVMFDAVAAWNAHLSTVQFFASQRGVTDRTGINQENEMILSDTIAGNAFGEHTLAVTLTATSGDGIYDADIIFNNAVTWGDYRGPLREDSEDMRRVALHELGHLLGLLHPDEAGQAVEALMNQYVSDLDTLAADDIAGAQSLYGVVGETSVNDQFADATIIELGALDSRTVFGSNVSASRESGEPNHGEVERGHSIWWRWTPPADLRVVLNTAGSNFDTVVAVYRGRALADLELVVENDDPDQPDNQVNRVRTSVATFNVTGGATYYIAVDGWGDVENFPEGTTGAVTMNIATDLVWASPTITRQASDALVFDGFTAQFSIEAEGYPELQYRWQVMAGEGSGWMEITADSSEYEGIDSATLAVVAVAARDGWQFRCVVSNAEGEQISEPKYLRLDPNVRPKILEQPVGLDLTLEDEGGLSVVAAHYIGFQWYFNDEVIPGATGPELFLGTIDADDTGSYHVVVTGLEEDLISETVEVTVDLGALIRLRNLSVRSSAGRDDSTLVVGFAVAGEVGKQLLIRGVGPELERFDVAGFANDPDLTLYDAESTRLTFNDDWDSGAETKAAFASVGAFALRDNSRDAVLLETFGGGAYTAHVTPGEEAAGIVIVEAYDAETESASRLTNLSARTNAGTGDHVLITGFVLSGPGEKKLLIRAVGPTLTDFGLPAGSLLANPQLDVRRDAELIASNRDWAGSEELQNAFQAVGAFPLGDEESLDSALIVTLPAGVYTATVSGVENSTGVVLVEIYEMP